MRPLYKGLVIALVHICIIAGLGGKLLYDRVTLPRAWAETMPYDPSMPIRGRYIQLQLITQIKGGNDAGLKAASPFAQYVSLLALDGRLTAESIKDDRHGISSDMRVRFLRAANRSIAVLEPPVVFFIPEHIQDPSIVKEGERLWVEVTIPKKGAPRPIRLGVRKENGAVVPLNIR